MLAEKGSQPLPPNQKAPVFVLKLESLGGWVSWVIAQKRRANTEQFFKTSSPLGLFAGIKHTSKTHPLLPPRCQNRNHNYDKNGD